jgi:hypothetical protein
MGLSVLQGVVERETLCGQWYIIRAYRVKEEGKEELEVRS